MEAKIIKREGKVEMDKDFQMLLNLLPNGEYDLKITKHKAKRTLDQNATMWMWLRCLGCAMRDYTGDERWSSKDGVNALYEMYCAKFLHTKSVNPKGEVVDVVKSSSKLSKAEMSNFLDAIKTDIMVEYGIQLPLPEDKYYSEFAAQYEDKY